jgi:hypothetical protein
MDLIDDVDLIFSLIWLEPSSFDELTDVLYSVIACSVDLDDIEHSLIIESSTVHTFMTGVSLLQLETVQSLCEYASRGRLSCSARTMKEVGMRDSPRGETISEDSCDIVL